GLIAPLLLPEPLRWRLLLLSALAIVGVVMITGADAFSGGANPYDELAILVAIMSGFVVVTVRKLHSTRNTATIFAAQCVFGFAICLGGAISGFSPMSLAAAAMIIISSVSVALGQLAMTQAFKTV